VLPGDVGRRRYVRLNLAGGRSVLGVVYPAEEADSRRRWTAARVALRDRIRVPQLIADDQAGAHIVEDFGRRDMAALFLETPSERAAWLARTVEAAAEMAAMEDPRINPAFEAALFRRELDLAREAVFDLYLQEPLTDGERSVHHRWADELAQEIANHPRALCHRDFHGNNLFPREEAVAAIDFQDMRTGPDAYDLASLLWERTTLDWMTAEIAEGAIAAFSRRRGVDAGTFRLRFDRVLLQRAWKVCGTFARAVAQGRGEAYKRYLPGELRLVRRLLDPTGSDGPFAALFEKRLARLLS
jgi:aminoglycoside/choline kinase family phosphotransferase